MQKKEKKEKIRKKIMRKMNNLTRVSIGISILYLVPFSLDVSGQETGLSLYKDPQGTFSIQYPIGWEVSPAQNRFENVEVEVSKPDLGFGQRVSVDVRILEDVGEELDIAGDLEEFLDLSIVKGSITNQVPGFSVEENIECGKHTIIDAEETCSVLYSRIDQTLGGRFATLSVAGVSGDDVYVISYTASPNEFDSNLAQGEQIINSFRITGDGGSEEGEDDEQDGNEDNTDAN
jgi:hypothetical protein